MADLNSLIAQGTQFNAPIDPFAQYAKMQQLEQGQQANMLARLKMDEYQRGLQEQNALRTAIPPDFDPSNPTHVAQVYRAAPTLAPGFIEKSLLAKKTSVDIGKTTAETEGKTFENKIAKANKAISDIAALNTPQEATSSIDQHLASGDIDQQKADMLKAQLAAAPSFSAWQKNMLNGILDAKDRLTNEREQQRIGLEQQRVGLEGKRVGLEGQRVGLEQQRVGLEGRRVTLAEKAQSTEGITPKEIQKREAAYPQQTAAIKGFETKSDAFIKDLKTLRDDPGLEQITGMLYGRTGSISREGSRAQALYDKIIAKGGFQALQDLRDASKTGGALGNVSNQEGKQLTSSFAAIDRRQNADDVRAAIDQAISDIEGSKTRMREAYDSTYSYKTGETPATGASAKATSKAPTAGTVQDGYRFKSGATVSNW